MSAGKVRRGAQTAWVRRRHSGHGRLTASMEEKWWKMACCCLARGKEGKGFSAVQTRQQRGAGEQSAWTGRVLDALPCRRGPEWQGGAWAGCRPAVLGRPKMNKMIFIYSNIFIRFEFEIVQSIYLRALNFLNKIWT
jgi:hypothetical protein